MDFVLGIVFVLSLMFLAIIFGDRMSLFGLATAEWLTAPFDAAAAFWDMICEAADRIWCFVFDNFWWVAATVSGGLGVCLIALMMVTSLSQKAEADRQDELSLMGVGSVLDHTATLKSAEFTLIKASGDPVRIDQLVHQVPSADRFNIPPAVRRRVISDFTVPVTEDVPPLETESPVYMREPSYSRSRLSLSMEPFVERVGRLVHSRELDQIIQSSLLSLRQDDWLTFSNAAAQNRLRDSPPGLREDSQFAVDDLYRQVRIIPGEAVSKSDIRVEKSAPEEAGSNEFTMEIRVTNLAENTFSGLIVRELLPAAWQVVDVAPKAVYRESAVTWLLDDLRPFEERTLTLTISSPQPGRYQSFTEVSATAAVSAVARVSRPLPAAPPERNLPPVERRPDVRLTLVDRSPLDGTVNEWVDIRFEIRNVGDAPAEGVSLRVKLPFGLDHHDLTPDDLNRTVDSRIRRLDPSERRQVRLTVRPTDEGAHFATAELIFQGAQLDVRTFDVVSRRPTNDSLPLQPRPDPLLSN